MKMRSYLVLLSLMVGLLILTGCSQQNAKPVGSEQENDAIQHVNMDMDTSPGDDFYSLWKLLFNL